MVQSEFNIDLGSKFIFFKILMPVANG
jgi:hypothetical protein